VLRHTELQPGGGRVGRSVIAMKFLSSLERSVGCAVLRRCAARRPISSEVSRERALVVAPHQDDETLGCGGMIAMKRLAGIPVEVVFLTDGSASHPNCPNVPPRRMSQIRRQEAGRACALLGVERGHLRFMELPDGKLAELGQEEVERVAWELSRILAQTRPREVFAPHPRDCWPDHEAASRITRLALTNSGLNARLLFYPVWLWQNLRLRSARAVRMGAAFRLNISSVLPTKLAAVSQYESQVNPVCGRPGCGCLPEGFLRHFSYPYETFFRSNGRGL